MTNIKYTGPANLVGNDAATFTIRANDGTVNPTLGTVNLDINSMPVEMSTETTYVIPTPAAPLDSYEIIVETVTILSLSGQDAYKDLLSRILVAGINGHGSTFDDRFSTFKALDIIPQIFFDKSNEQKNDNKKELDPSIKDSNIFENFQISPEAQEFIDDLKKHLDDLEDKKDDENQDLSFYLDSLIERNKFIERNAEKEITQTFLDFRSCPENALLEEFDCFKIKI